MVGNGSDHIPHAAVYIKAFYAAKTKADRLGNCVKGTQRSVD